MGVTNPYAPSCDQIVPGGGYVVGNMRWVSWWYNRVKNIHSDSFTEDLLYRMAVNKGWVQPTGE